jgi:hypothetical protein
MNEKNQIKFNFIFYLTFIFYDVMEKSNRLKHFNRLLAY